MTSSKGQEYHDNSECKFSPKNIKETAQSFNNLIYTKPQSKKGKINIGLRSSKAISSVKPTDDQNNNANKPEY